jgi:hypothetical protein
VRYFESVRRILRVSSRELIYDERARSTSEMGQLVCAGMLEVLFTLSVIAMYQLWWSTKSRCGLFKQRTCACVSRTSGNHGMATFERVGRTSHKGGFASGLRMQVLARR